MAEAVKIIVEDEGEEPVVSTGDDGEDLPGGGVVINLNRGENDNDEDDIPGDDEFYKNLAMEIEHSRLSIIAEDLITAIEHDDESRSNYLANRARGFEYLGLDLPNPKSSVSDSSSAVPGQSTVNNPLLLEAVLKGWAGSVGEFLPAAGPAKIEDTGDETSAEDDLAEALERDVNTYLTQVATEYYPDTSHMLLWGPYFGGSGFKKVYRCPMRRRPVSESVDVKDLIVSDTMKDLASCERITHAIEMRPSVMKRMQMIGAYRKVELTQPQPIPNVVTEKIAGIQGTSTHHDRPEDEPFTVWESQCELDLPEYAPDEFRDEGIPLPYLVTVNKDSREILAIRRDWNEHDESCQRKRLYVRWPYVPGPGFYGTGLLQMLGNATAAMTAAWREALDAGMYASFPGGLIVEAASRQKTSNFQVSPGEYKPVQTGGMPIQQAVMPLPYRDVTPGLMAMIDKIIGQSQAVGGVADVPAAEGIQNVPVGTMLTQVEQATKVMSAAHKGMHAAQSLELQMLLDLFRAYPEDWMRCCVLGDKKRAGFWDEQKFQAALDNTNLVPVSDPNVPAHIHRVAKAIALTQLIMIPQFASRIDPKEALMRCLRAIREDPNGLVIDPPPQQNQPSPDLIKAQAAMMTAQSNQQKAMVAAQQIGRDTQLRAAELALEKQIADTNLQREQIIHAADQAKIQAEQEAARRAQAVEEAKLAEEAHRQSRQQGIDHFNTQREHAISALDIASRAGLERAKLRHTATMDAHSAGLEAMKTHHDMAMDHAQHALDKYEVMHPPKPAAKKASGGGVPGFASGGAVAVPSTPPSSWSQALNRLSAAFEHMAQVQTMPHAIVRDQSGTAIGVRRGELKSDRPSGIKVKILDDNEQ